ncbi:MAG: LLM class flavin-dependent oxidoreductase [Thermomicrobiales bacterium]|nr:LLM class flavin-dependent oxidoreductase [Thermomicrobiales bacterium]
MSLDVSRFGFGIVGATPHDLVRELAPMVEQAGFNTLWFNHTTQANAYEAIAVAAQVTTTIRLATGVTNLDGVMPTREIIANVRDLDLPLDRLIIGIGANQPPSPLRSVSEAIGVLKDELPSVPVVVGALGPKMRALGVQQSQGVLLNWLTPAGAELAMVDRAQDAPNTDAQVALYIRCSLGAEGRIAMQREAHRYQNIASYKANFGRLGFSAMDAAVCADTSTQIREGLAQYQSVVDQPVLRAIVGNETIADYASLVDACRN